MCISARWQSNEGQERVRREALTPVDPDGL